MGRRFLARRQAQACGVAALSGTLPEAFHRAGGTRAFRLSRPDGRGFTLDNGRLKYMSTIFSLLADQTPIRFGGHCESLSWHIRQKGGRAVLGQQLGTNWNRDFGAHCPSGSPSSYPGTCAYIRYVIGWCDLGYLPRDDHPNYYLSSCLVTQASHVAYFPGGPDGL